MRNMLRTAALSGAMLGAFALPGASATAATTSFSNAQAIVIPSIGPANPYPSEIGVAGLCGNVTKATVTLHGLSHDFPEDLDVLVVGPSGQKTLLMSDSGPGALADVTLTFDDEAANPIPQTDVVSGTYRPADYEGGSPDTFSPLAPAGPYVASLAEFTGTAPNGTWQLFVVDDFTGTGGAVARGWTLNLTTADCSPPPPGATVDCQGTSVTSTTGTENDDNLVGTLDADTLFGLGGSDELDGVDGNDCLDGGDGDDRVSGGADDDLVKGGDGRDKVRGVGGMDRLKGQGGVDRVNGGEGADKLSGGRGADKLNGGAAKDGFRGNAGNDDLNAVDAKTDRVNCGAGDDKAVVDPIDRVSDNCENVREVEKD